MAIWRGTVHCGEPGQLRLICLCGTIPACGAGQRAVPGKCEDWELSCCGMMPVWWCRQLNTCWAVRLQVAFGRLILHEPVSDTS